MEGIRREEILKRFEERARLEKNDLAAEKEEFNRKIKEKSIEIGEKTSLIEGLKQKILDLEKNLEKKVRTEGSDNSDRALKDLKEKNEAFEEKIRGLEREMIVRKAEFEKEKALLSGKISYFEKNYEEAGKKEKEIGNELKNARKEWNLQMKEMSQKYEQNIKTYLIEIEELKEKNAELEVRF